MLISCGFFILIYEDKNLLKVSMLPVKLPKKPVDS